MTSIEILKKFFCNEAMQATVIKECLEIFIKTLQLLYQPDCDNDCKQNVREFLEFLHDFDDSTPLLDESKTSQGGLKEFVYNAIKYFAEQNPKAYQNSNLINLMNKVVDQRRGDIFEDNMSVSSMTGNLSGRGNALEEKSFVRNDTITLTNMSS